MSTAAPIGFQIMPLPRWLRVANGAAAIVSGERWELTPERFMTAAGHAAGLPPEFPAHVHEALEVLCKSLRDDAKLHWFGTANTEDLLVTGLAEMLRVEKMFADDPSLAKTPLLSPVIVTGLPRSGTTFLHRLLSASPDAIGVPMYRHVYPTRPEPFDYRLRLTQVKFFPWLAASKVYGLDAIHYVRPELPDECNFGMRLAGRSIIYWATSPVHTYLRWLLTQDLREGYQLYRKVLILHQRANPGRRLTLKCPHHLAWLPALTETLPEAIIVQTHRDPVEVVPSECKLILSLQGLSVREIDVQRTVESNHLKVVTYAERSAAFADTDAGRRILHLDYRTLVRDPVGAAADIHQRANLPFTSAHRNTLGRFAAENRQHKHGKHVYSLGEFGLDEAKIKREFAAYRERFLRA
ncbi:MAG: sulfotransferase [Polyangiaceae bacterium]|nr:sulfotransferase [Polyangiaceae bacterium]